MFAHITTPTPISPTLKAVQEIISVTTGGSYEPTDIQPTSDFEENLHIDMETDFPKIVKRVNQVFMTQFSAQELMEEVETVADLVDIIDVETELG
jgi:hypothetical protein